MSYFHKLISISWLGITTTAAGAFVGVPRLLNYLLTEKTHTQTLNDSGKNVEYAKQIETKIKDYSTEAQSKQTQVKHLTEYKKQKDKIIIESMKAIKQNTAEVTQIQKNIEKTKKDLLTLNNKKATFVVVTTKAKKKIEDKTRALVQTEKSIKSLSEEISKLSIKKTQEETKIQEKKIYLDDCSHQATQSLQTFTQIQKDIHKLNEQQIKPLQKSLEDLAKKKLTNREEYRSKSKELSILKNKYNQELTKVHESHNSYSMYLTNKKKITSEIKKYKDKLITLDGGLSEKSTKLTDAQKENGNAQRIVKEERQKLLQVQAAEKEMQATIRLHNKDKITSYQQMNQHRKEISQAKKELIQTKESLKPTNNQLKQHTKELQETMKKIMSSETELENIEKEWL